MYFYYRAQKQVRVTRSKYLYYAIINRVGGLARAIPGSFRNLWSTTAPVSQRAHREG